LPFAPRRQSSTIGRLSFFSSDNSSRSRPRAQTSRSNVLSRQVLDNAVLFCNIFLYWYSSRKIFKRIDKPINAQMRPSYYYMSNNCSDFLSMQYVRDLFFGVMILSNFYLSRFSFCRNAISCLWKTSPIFTRALMLECSNHKTTSS